MSVTTPPVQPTEGQGQPAVAPPVPAPAAPPVPAPAAPAAGNTPWANDLNALFTDDATRGQVDQFLRAKVQPYTTQLEQQVASSKDAQRLWNDLSQSPVDTYVAITQEMFGEDAAQVLLNTIQQQLAQQPGEAPPPAPQGQQQADPRLENVLSYVEQQQNQALYDQELARITTEHSEVNADWFHPFVAAANGDFNQAYDLYSSWLAQVTAGTTPPPAAEVPATPPNVMASDTGAAATGATPVQPAKQSLDAAINDFMAEQRATREAPPVGTA